MFTFDGNKHLLLIEIHTYWQRWKYILTVMEIHIDCDWNTFGLLVEIHIYFWWKYIFTFGSPGRSPSSFIVFWPSGLQWPKRNRWPFLRAYRHRTTFVPISHQPAMMMIPSKTRTRINLYWFCTATADRWKNNLVKYETSHIFF